MESDGSNIGESSFLCRGDEGQVERQGCTLEIESTELADVRGRERWECSAGMPPAIMDSN